MNPLISVIIPVYNTKKYLRKCVKSVVNQTISDLEIILVDDGSSDGSADLCDELHNDDYRIHVIHKKNGGLSSARNAGIRVATGRFITFLDSDDYISSTMYEEMIDAFKKYGNPSSIVCERYVRVNEQGEIIPTFCAHENEEVVTSISYLRELLLHKGDVSACTKLFPREMIDKVSFNEERLNEDLLFMIDLMPLFQSVIFTGKIGYFYLTRENSISSKYGKAVVDMSINSVYVNDVVQEKYSKLRKEGYRFALYQNMAYLLLVPLKQRNKDNCDYNKALRYLKIHFLKDGIFNSYLSMKNKIVMIGLIIKPDIMVSIFQWRHKL